MAKRTSNRTAAAPIINIGISEKHRVKVAEGLS